MGILTLGCFFGARDLIQRIFLFALRIDDHELTQGIFGVVSPRTLATGLTRTTYERLLSAKEIAVRVQFANNGTEDYAFLAVKTDKALQSVVHECPVDSAGRAEPMPFDPAKGLKTPDEARAFYYMRKNEIRDDNYNRP